MNEMHDDPDHRLGRAVALLEMLLDPARDAGGQKRARAMAREFLAEENERRRPFRERMEAHNRTARPDGPRADAPVEVVAEAEELSCQCRSPRPCYRHVEDQ
jgi:hypothetical protein